MSEKPRTYFMSSAMSPNLVVEVGATRTASLAPSDIPVSFAVATTEDNSGDVELRISLDYLHATQEEIEYWTHGRVRIGAGKFSQRLLVVAVRIPFGTILAGGDNLKRATEEMQRSLATAFRELTMRSHLARAKMNIGATKAGLSVDYDDAPPAWMIDALGSLGQRPSSSGRGK